jgi:broad specificity phosphatase PhoE
VTRFLLVRHGEHDLLGRAIAGRAPGIALNASGRAQAGELAERLNGAPIDAIYSSPQQRALETAAPLAARRRLSVAVDQAFDEIDFGEWTGLTFERLRRDEAWRLWVERKSIACPPGGEPFSQARVRAMTGVERLEKLHPEHSVLLVSHGDIVKALLATYLGMSLDHLQRFEIAPASLSVVLTGPGWSQVQLVNGRAGLLA